MGIFDILGIQNPFSQIKQNLGQGIIDAPFPERPAPPTPEAIQSLDALIASLFPEQAQNPMGLGVGETTPAQTGAAGVMAAGAEQGLPADNPGLGALAALKEKETRRPEAVAKPSAVERRPLPNVQPRRPGQGSDMAIYRQAIKDIESSGGNYKIIGATHPKLGRALGAYQVMEGNLPSWSKEVLGRVVSPEEFLNSPAIQDQIFDAKFGQSIRRYGSPEDAASVWFTGRPTSNKSAGGAKDVHGTTGSGYVSQFSQNVAKYSGGQPLPQTASVEQPQPPLLNLLNRANGPGQPQGDRTRPPPKRSMVAEVEPAEEATAFTTDTPATRRRQEIIAQFSKRDTSALKRMPRTEIISLLQEMGKGVAGIPRITKAKEIA